MYYLYPVYILVALAAEFSLADREYMISKSESVIVPLNFETKLDCVMNIKPDRFQWKFYPLNKTNAYNPEAQISLTSHHFEFVPEEKYQNNTQNEMSSLSLQVNSEEIAGDYQCLAHYGASVVASIPWRVTISKIGNFPIQNNITATLVPGNTINWRCLLPSETNPSPYVEYLKDDVYMQPVVPFETKSLIIPSAEPRDSGRYTCRVGNVEGSRNSRATLNLDVIRHGPREPPRFIMPPRATYSARKGETVYLECAAVGNPPPELTWMKVKGTLPRGSRTLNGTLEIRNFSADDEGEYNCLHQNYEGAISHSMKLNYQEAPKIQCLFETTDVTQGENLELDCNVTGRPQPEITWFLNGFVVTNDSKIQAEGNKIFFKPIEKRHAGKLQIFARNIVETEYRSLFITVIPLSTTQENTSDTPVPPTKRNRRKKKNNPRKNGKHGTMVPPSPPNITRINDETVLVRWTVQPKGLPIQFFKVQYRELGPANLHEQYTKNKASKWMTLNADIPPHIRDYEVTNLKPDYFYRFRIAAVYSNNDNQESPNSDKFHLTRYDFDDRNPLPVPIITRTEAINTTSVKIYWKCEIVSSLSVDGFFVSYLSASSAGDYMKASVDGNSTFSYILAHLQPDTVYDIKLQSFSTKSASGYSAVHKVKTLALPTTTVGPLVTSTPNSDNGGISKLYIIIAGILLGGAAVIIGIIALLVIRRKTKSKDNDNGNHIQADSKGGTRTNGCAPGSRITITSNPLADADNKNQNMIEMSCLSSQNNNCSTTVQASSSEEVSPTNSRDKKNKTREKRIRNKQNVSSTAPGEENYV